MIGKGSKILAKEKCSPTSFIEGLVGRETWNPYVKMKTAFACSAWAKIVCGTESFKGFLMGCLEIFRIR